MPDSCPDPKHRPNLINRSISVPIRHICPSCQAITDSALTLHGLLDYVNRAAAAEDLYTALELYVAHFGDPLRVARAALLKANPQQRQQPVEHKHRYRGTGGPCVECGRGIYIERAEREQSEPNNRLGLPGD